MNTTLFGSKFFFVVQIIVKVNPETSGISVQSLTKQECFFKLSNRLPVMFVRTNVPDLNLFFPCKWSVFSVKNNNKQKFRIDSGGPPQLYEGSRVKKN